MIHFGQFSAVAISICNSLLVNFASVINPFSKNEMNSATVKDQSYDDSMTSILIYAILALGTL